jgi:hypothetical protein
MKQYDDEYSDKYDDRVRLISIIDTMQYQIDNLEEEILYLKDKLDFHGIPFKEILK